jgi:hypothetical protein
MQAPMTQEQWTALDRFFTDLLAPPDSALEAAFQARGAVTEVQLRQPGSGAERSRSGYFAWWGACGGRAPRPFVLRWQLRGNDTDFHRKGPLLFLAIGSHAASAAVEEMALWLSDLLVASAVAKAQIPPGWNTVSAVVCDDDPDSW